MMKFWLLRMLNRNFHWSSCLKLASQAYLIFFLVSCAKTDDEIGLVNEGGSLNSFQVDTFSITTKSVLTTTDLSNSSSAVFLGTYNSNSTGINSNSVFTSVAPIDLSYRFPSGTITPTSLKLHCRSISSYGVSTPQDFNIYQLEDVVAKGEAYTFRDSLKSSSTVLGSFNLSSDYKGNISADLDLSLGQKIIDFGNVAFTTTETFVELFKGLAIIPHGLPGVDQGLIYEMDADSIYLELVTKDESNNLDTLLFKTPSTSRSFYHTYYSTSTSEASSSYNNDSYSGEFTYIQGLGGISTELTFPSLNKWYNSNKFLINSALLVFTVADGSDSEFSSPSNLIIHEVSKASNQGIQSSALSSKTYTIDIQRFLSQYLVENKTCQFNLSVINSHIHPEMVKLFGPNHSATPLKLVINYTEY